MELSKTLIKSEIILKYALLSCHYKSEKLVSAWLMSNLHMGQVVFLRSQSSMQVSWN